MRAVLLNTGTELLAGDVHDTHLAFIAREIFSLGLRIEERRTVADGAAIGETLRELFARAEIIFVTGGLGPTSGDSKRAGLNGFPASRTKPRCRTARKFFQTKTEARRDCI